MKNFLIWAGCVLVLVIGACISAEAYIYVDDWQGNIEGSLSPFVVAAALFGLFMMPASYLYGRYVIEPNDCVNGEGKRNENPDLDIAIDMLS